MKRISSKSRKATAILLSLLLLSAVFAGFPTKAAAASEFVEVTTIWYPRGGGTDTWGSPALTLMNGWELAASTMYTVKAISNRSMLTAYCIQPGIPLRNADQNPLILPGDFLATYDNGVLSADQIQSLLGRVLYYGFTGTASIYLTDDQLADITATQILIWEVVVGEQDADFNYIAPTGGFARALDSVKAAHPLRAGILAEYDRIVASMKNHSVIPSFMSDSLTSAVAHELVLDGDQYAVTLTDTNGVLSDFAFSSSDPGVSFTKDGADLTVTTAAPITDDVGITASRAGYVRDTVVFWASGSIEVKGEVQGLVMSGQEIADPVSAFMFVSYDQPAPEDGRIRIVKRCAAEDIPLAGALFGVYRASDDELVDEILTGSDGVGLSKALPEAAGGYYLVELSPPPLYQPNDEEIPVEVINGETVEITVSNEPLEPDPEDDALEIIKEDDAGGKLPGAVFGVYRADDDTKVAELTTGADGTVRHELPEGDYYLRELECEGYVLIIDPIPFTITADKDETVTVVNTPIPDPYGRVKLIKESDSGDRLEEAVFGVYRAEDDEKLAEITTGSTGEAVYDLPPGNYYLVELSCEGYVIKTEKIPFTVVEDETVEITAVNEPIPPVVVEGRVQLVKRAEGTGTPLSGAVFGVYKALNDVKVTELTTNSSGEAAVTLPFGDYYLKEIKAPDGYWKQLKFPSPSWTPARLSGSRSPMSET